MDTETKYKANFLWPFEIGSIEEAGYEFANAIGIEYQKMWWKVLIARIRINECNIVKELVLSGINKD